MTKKIFRSILIVVTGVLLANMVIVMGCLYEYYRNEQEKQLRDELRLAAYGVEESGRAYLEKMTARDYRYSWAPDYRLTWIASDGAVLFDTAEPAGEMENHGDRVEVREAFASGESTSVRYSSTLTEQAVYYARALKDGTVLRISIRRATVFTLIMLMMQPLVIVSILAVVLSAVLAHRMAKRIVSPINSLDLDHPLENNAYEELSPLLRRIHQQRQQIVDQMRNLQKRTDEFMQITSHMNEGLVLLDNAGKIISINPAARSIFRADHSCLGEEFLRIDHSYPLSEALRTAMESGHGGVRVQRGGREYQFDLSRIESEGAVIGAVLLAFDVTEQAAAERTRQEFTANVSHELKTPLQSIMGSAELLENNLVKPGDEPRFFHLIRGEAERLLALVEDIIHLSQLDEGADLTFERVDLSKIAREAAASLQSAAEERGAALSVTGEPAYVTGAEGLLREMIYNLCNNAVKYNVEGGRVEISVQSQEKSVTLSVKDTGIGIPEEYQTRVFERFFRVDKSRSKASGGTGLGLSIVKHIAQVHRASVRLTSRLGEGTEVVVSFPPPDGGLFKSAEKEEK